MPNSRLYYKAADRTIWILWPLRADLLFPYFENNHHREINFSTIIPKSELSSLLPGIPCPVRLQGYSAPKGTEMGAREEAKDTRHEEAALWRLWCTLWLTLKISMCCTMQCVPDFISNRHSAFHISILNLIVSYNILECDVTLTEPFQYATVVIKTFTQQSIWSHPWKSDSYPEQFLFLFRNTGRGHTRALPSRAERSGQGPSCQARRVVEGLEAPEHSGHAASGVVEGRKTSSNKTFTS